MGITEEFEWLKKSAGRIPIHRGTFYRIFNLNFRRIRIHFLIAEEQSKYQEVIKIKNKGFPN
jgi:hypothetical protein